MSTTHPEGFLLSEIKRLQRYVPREQLPDAIAKYVEERYYPRVLCQEDIRVIQKRAVAGLTNEQLWDKIVSTVCANAQMTWETVRHRSRKKEIVLVRRMIIFLARLRTDFTLERIGDKFGFDHTTIIHSNDAMSNLLDADDGLREQVEFLNSQI